MFVTQALGLGLALSIGMPLPPFPTAGQDSVERISARLQEQIDELAQLREATEDPERLEELERAQVEVQAQLEKLQELAARRSNREQVREQADQRGEKEQQERVARLRYMKQQAREFRETGQLKKAMALEDEIARFASTSNPQAKAQNQARLRQRLGELSGRLEEAGPDQRRALLREIQEIEDMIYGGRKAERPERRRESERREAGREPEQHERLRIQEKMEHLLVAAERLEAAGEEGLANELRQKAEELGREIGGRQHPEVSAAMVHEMMDAIHQLQEQVHELRSQLDQLRRALEQR